MEAFVDGAIDKLNATVTGTVCLTVHFGWIRKNKYHSWAWGKLKFYIKYKNYIVWFKKSNA
jgi:hypothetical protein